MTRFLQGSKRGKRGSQPAGRGAGARRGADGGGREGRQPPSWERANLELHLCRGRRRVSPAPARLHGVQRGVGGRGEPDERAPRSVNYHHPRPGARSRGPLSVDDRPHGAN